MFVSVVMSIYNETTNEIEKSILSILNQTYNNFEFIIVIDNPRNIEIIELVKNFSIKDKRIKYVINKKNIGLALSLNKGIEIASGDYIARMDGDDISKKDRLEKQINYLYENSDICLLGSFAESINEDGKKIGNLKVETNFEKIKRKMKYENCFIHPSVVFKKEVFKKVGGYRKFPCAQDYDLFSRIVDNGYKASNLSDFLLLYKVRENNLTNKKRLLQVLLSEYIHKLSKERKKNNGKDNFNTDEIKKIEILFEKEKENFDKAREIVKEYNKNKFLLVLNIPRIIFKSKYYLFVIKNKIKILL